MRIRVRLFAIQRELAGTREVPLELADGGSVEDAWRALIERYPALAPGRSFVRFARNADYAEPGTLLSDGDELAVIPPVSGGAEQRILELRAEPFAADILAELEARLATPEDGAVVGFIGRTRATPGTPAPGQEAEAAQHAGRAVESLDYEAHEPMAIGVLGQIADEILERFGVERLAIVHRTGEVPLGEASWRSWRWRRIAMPRSRRLATRSTRRRHAPRSGRPSSSATATYGSASPPGWPPRSAAVRRDERWPTREP